MMHPQTHPITPKPLTTAPAWESATAVAGVDEIPMAHLDYNLHPLLVQGLEHYVVSAGEDERFCIR
ncbi:hypothetical protein GCM10008098_18150 [Rhodanobacter panaciterrae]|uniref:Uncharacterized protein n=1 Tax=Rhodanobacter panaciterrae TaxID=490572 RepID=A0ABQ2ZWZ3_9GAMM|nr:hypothetical protein [Rhodanobacter panaciterrae]GGY24887.1 hypothetical protein GCM10008098_18150 [Rhodanobacter panaciterrae]